MTSLLSGHLSIGLQADFIPEGILLRHTPPFRRNYPQVSLTIRSLTLDAIESELIGGTLDFALVSGSENTDFLTLIDCGQITYAPVCTKEYAAKCGPFTSAEDVMRGELIDVGPHKPTWNLWLAAAPAALRTALQHTSSICTVPNFYAALELVRAAGGVACLPRELIESQGLSTELIEFKSLKPGVRPLLLAHRKKNTRSLVESVFLEHLLESRPLI